MVGTKHSNPGAATWVTQMSRARVLLRPNSSRENKSVTLTGKSDPATPSVY